MGNKAKSKDEGKNFASWRTLPLSEQLAKYLKRLYAHRRQMQAKYGSQYEVNNYICKWDDGRPFKPDYVTRSWSSFLKRMGQPHIRFHDLRHSSASLLVTLGFQLKEIQEWLGHKDSRSTDMYAHLYTDKNDMASKVNERLIFDFGEYER